MADLPDDVILQAVQRQMGGSSNYAGFGDLRADMVLRMYFQQTLKKAMFTNKQFQEFFEARPDTWEVEPKKARVRVRPLEQKLGASLQRAQSQHDVVSAILGAGEELGRLTMEVAVPALLHLSTRGADPSRRRQSDVAVARDRLLAVFPADQCVGSLTLRMILEAFDVCLLSGGSKGKEHAVESLSAGVIARLKAAPKELEWELLGRCLALPLEGASAGPALAEAVSVLLASPRPAGVALHAMVQAAELGEPFTPLVEMLGSAELAAKQWPSWPAALAALNCIAEAATPGSRLLQEVAATLAPPLLQHLPPQDVCDLATQISSKGVAIDTLLLVLTFLSPQFKRLGVRRLLSIMVMADGAVAGSPHLRPVAEAAANTVVSQFLELDVSQLLSFTQGLLYLGQLFVPTQQMLDFWTRLLQAATTSAEAPASTGAELSKLNEAQDADSLLDVIAQKKMRLLAKTKTMAPEPWLQRWRGVDGLMSADQLAWLLRLLVVSSCSPRLLEAVASRVLSVAPALTLEGRESLGTAVLSEVTFPGKTALKAALAEAEKAATEAALAEAAQRQNRERRQVREASPASKRKRKKSRSPSERKRPRR